MPCGRVQVKFVYLQFSQNWQTPRCLMRFADFQFLDNQQTQRCHVVRFHFCWFPDSVVYFVSQFSASLQKFFLQLWCHSDITAVNSPTSNIFRVQSSACSCKTTDHNHTNACNLCYYQLHAAFSLPPWTSFHCKSHSSQHRRLNCLQVK